MHSPCWAGARYHFANTHPSHGSPVHYLDESHIQLFLVQLLLLLAVARTLGVACQRIKIPALAGEILTGVVLGPTLLGRISPELQSALFPVEVIQMAMLDTVSWLGVFFLLLSVGFEVDVSRAIFRQGKAALSVGIVGVLVPVAVGFPVFWFLDQEYHGPNATRLGFTLFLAVAGSITAISGTPQPRSVGQSRAALSSSGERALRRFPAPNAKALSVRGSPSRPSPA